MGASQMIKVLVADDHNLVRKGIVELLNLAEDIQVIGEAADGKEAVELAEKIQPDVLVMDISMPRMNGLQATERVAALHLKTRVVILSMYADDALVRLALKYGAVGYLLKRSVTEELHLAVRAANRNEIFVCPAVSRAVLEDGFQEGSADEVVDAFGRLSAREREVLQLIAEGHTNASIANNLSISVKTVEKHRANLMAKMEVNDLASLLKKAYKQKLTFLDD